MTAPLTSTIWLAAFCVVTTVLQLVSVGIAAIRCRQRPGHLPPPPAAASVSVVRPVCGLDPFARETLESTFKLDYPDYEVIFCLADAEDAAAPLLRELIAAHPDVPARLLIGEHRVSSNPKLNNVVKGWHAAQHQWIVMADSNVLLPRDYIQRLAHRWQEDTGLVCAPPRGGSPTNACAELECAFLNTFQARFQYVGEALGHGFAQGKTMFFRRDVVDDGGGIRALGAELAEDAASTKLVHAAGLRVHLADNPFEQPLGDRSFTEVWKRQLRWARLRRITFPAFFAPELFVGTAFPLLAAGFAAAQAGISVPGTLLALLIVWYGAELWLARVAGWHLSWKLPFAFLVRDIMLPVLWIDAWAGDSFVWRGNGMNVHVNESEESSEPVEAWP